MAYVSDWWVGVLGALLMFSLAVFAHELGHFVVAKLTGVGVKEFAIGMGKKLLSFKYGPTVYSIRMLPLGGFVQLTGVLPEEEEEEAAQKEDETGAVLDAVPQSQEDKEIGETVMEDVEALRGKPTLVKVAIFTAGVTMNFVAAMVGIAIFFAVGFKEQLPLKSQVGYVDEKSSYYESGLRTLDTIVSVNGHAVKDWDQIATVVTAERAKNLKEWTVEVQRDGQSLTLKTKPLFDPVVDENSDYILQPAFPAYIAGVFPGKPASRARAPQATLKQEGLLEGDMVLAINGQPIKYFYEMERVVKSSPNEVIELKVQRNGVDKPILFYTEIAPNPDKPGQGLLGVIRGNPEHHQVREPVLTAIKNAPGRTADKAVQITVLTFSALGRLFTNFESAKSEMGGPVAIMSMAYQASRSGIERFIQLFVVLNLALMVFNLLPIPVLDGGHIAISIIEGVSRRQIPPKILTQAYTAVAILLICLMLLLTYQDLKTWVFKM